ncbi:MAG: NMD3-related protein [Candidatus Diapherotrites archaeon]|nr:NMD3-related protein [Candidatus Diapherotrites archaeon]
MSKKNSSLFCPKCGKTSGNFIQGFCQDCFLEDHDLISIESRLPVEYCTRCLRLKFRGRWVTQTETVLQDLVKGHLKIKQIVEPEIFIELNPLGSGETQTRITVSGILNEEKIRIEKAILLIPKKDHCNACNKMASGYFESILQVRWKEREKGEKIQKKMEDFIKDYLDRESEKDPMSFIAKKSITEYGLDYFLGSKQAARKLSRVLVETFQGELVTSFKLHTQIKNEVKKRLTYCVRI